MNRIEFIQLTGLGLAGLACFPAVFSPGYSREELMGINVKGLVGDNFKLRPAAAEAFKDMRKAALKAGFQLYSVSSFRNYERQEGIWTRKYNRFTGQGLSPQKAIEKIIEYSTIPGTSRHHWGTDLDVIDKNPPTPSDPLLARHFHDNGPYAELKKWLDAHAESFGFHEVYTNATGRKGFKYEPWHFSYRPVAKDMLKAYLEIDLKGELQRIQLPGSRYFTDSFIERYRNEQVLDINPDLL